MSVLVLENDCIKASLNTFGGLIESIIDKHTGLDHAWEYDASRWPRRTALCFPFCGKCKDGRYTYNEVPYEIPSHGFAREREFAVVSHSNDHLVLQDRFDSTTLEMYPFEYRLQIEYLLEDASLVVKYHVSNEGPCTMYYSIGSHYAYQLPRIQEECYLHFPTSQHAGCLDLADGTIKADILEGRSVVPLEGLIDDSSLILDLKQMDASWIGVGGLEGPFTKVSGEGFRYVLVWAPVGGRNPFVCIEFWDGMADLGVSSGKIEEKFAVRTLESGETRSYLQCIRF